jgi:DUF4097 and DUF4098 domain-containing protein YvlB
MPVHEFQTPGPVLLRIAVPRGEVTVAAGAEGSVDVEVFALEGDDTSRVAAEETRVEVHERRGRYEVVIEAPKRGGRLPWREAKLGVRVSCPDGADLELNSASADLDARGRLGAVEVKTASGDVVAAACESLAVASASGDVQAGEVAQDLSVKTASGDVEVESVGGRTAVNCVSGDVRVGHATGLVTLNSVSGDMELEALAGGGLRANTVSGDLSIGVVTGLRLWIDAHSVSGSMSSNFELGDEPPGEGGSDDVVEVRARSVSGDVHIARAASRA